MRRIMSYVVLYAFVANAALPFGVGYGPFRSGQSPSSGVFPTEAQMREDMGVLKRLGFTKIQTYANDAGTALYNMPKYAADSGLTVMAGAWISSSYYCPLQTNVNNLIKQAKAFSSITSVKVGDLPITNGGLSQATLVNLVKQVNDSLSIPVTVMETMDAWKVNTNLANAVDVISVSVFPQKSGILIDAAAKYVTDCVDSVRKWYPNKTVILGETGWRKVGTVDNQAKFVTQFKALDSTYLNSSYYFIAFDEAWKGSDGTYGLFQADRTLKPTLVSVFNPNVSTIKKVRPPVQILPSKSVNVYTVNGRQVKGAKIPGAYIAAGKKLIKQ